MDLAVYRPARYADAQSIHVTGINVNTKPNTKPEG